MKKLESLKDDRFSKFETDKISNMISIKGGENTHCTGNNLANTCWETKDWCTQVIKNSKGEIIGTERVEDNELWYQLDSKGAKTTLPCN